MSSMTAVKNWLAAFSLHCSNVAVRHSGLLRDIQKVEHVYKVINYCTQAAGRHGNCD